MSTEDIRSHKPDPKKILGGRLSSRKVLRSAVFAAAIFAVAIALNEMVLPAFGRKFLFDSGRLRFQEYKSYSKKDERILRILINDTALLGKIPQLKDLSVETGWGGDELQQCLSALAEKGDISLNHNGIILDAYPWTSEKSDFRVLLAGKDSSTIGPLQASSALYALSVMPLFEKDGRIEAMLRDTGESLIIEIKEGEIAFTSNLAAVVYRTEKYADSHFYASMEGARADHRGDFDINRVIRLDRALLIGDIIADEIKDKIDR